MHPGMDARVGEAKSYMVPDAELLATTDWKLCSDLSIAMLHKPGPPSAIRLPMHGCKLGVSAGYDIKREEGELPRMLSILVRVILRFHFVTAQPCRGPPKDKQAASRA
jgi:hypothetical protein